MTARCASCGLRGVVAGWFCDVGKRPATYADLQLVLG